MPKDIHNELIPDDKVLSDSEKEEILQSMKQSNEPMQVLVNKLRLEVVNVRNDMDMVNES